MLKWLLVDQLELFWGGIIGKVVGVAYHDDFSSLLFVIIGIFFGIAGPLKKDSIRRGEAAREKRKKQEQEEETQELERIRSEQEEKARLQASKEKERYLKSLVSESEGLLSTIPTTLKSAENYLDKAEEEFKDGVFAPFWDQIENAANQLAAYHQKVNHLTTNAKDYEQQRSGSDSPFKLPMRNLPDARPTAARLAKIVRVAQKDFHFASIYEQRKTNKLLYEGFRSLGDAIYSLGDQISYSLQSLSDQIHVSLNDLIGSSHEQVRAINQQREDMERQHEDIRRYAEDAKNASAQEAAARRKFEKESSTRQKEQGEMLDNIQRGRKPRW